MIKTILGKGLVNSIKREGDEEHYYFIKDKGQDFIQDFETQRAKLFWDIVKFGGSYMLGFATAYFCHK